jgi:hypothetical protein
VRLRAIIERIERADQERRPDQTGGLVVDLVMVTVYFILIYTAVWR